MLNTPLARLRKSLPTAPTLREVAAFFARRGFPRGWQCIGAFERGQFKQSPDRFLMLYAEAIRAPLRDVVLALERTKRLRNRRATAKQRIQRRPERQKGARKYA